MLTSKEQRARAGGDSECVRILGSIRIWLGDSNNIQLGYEKISF